MSSGLASSGMKAGRPLGTLGFVSVDMVGRWVMDVAGGGARLCDRLTSDSKFNGVEAVAMDEG